LIPDSKPDSSELNALDSLHWRMAGTPTSRWSFMILPLRENNVHLLSFWPRLTTSTPLLYKSLIQPPLSRDVAPHSHSPLYTLIQDCCPAPPPPLPPPLVPALEGAENC
jgi:hypothetical protein